MKYTPKEVSKTVFDINYQSLYQNGYRYLIFDVDNTLAKYTEKSPSSDIINLFNKLKQMGFSTYLISNNNKTRLDNFSASLPLAGVLYHANKPQTKKIWNYFKDQHISISEVVGIGDQLVTDMLCYNRLGAYAILVKTIDVKCQKWYTKINRLREKKIIKKITLENPSIGGKISNL